MPYKSDAQRGKFHMLEKEGKISKKTVDEFDKASKGMKLPEKVGDPAGFEDIPETMEPGSTAHKVDISSEFPKELKQRSKDYTRKGLMQPEWLHHPQIKAK